MGEEDSIGYREAVEIDGSFSTSSDIEEGARMYGNWHCQASKGFDKHVRDDDAGFVDTSKIYLDC